MKCDVCGREAAKHHREVSLLVINERCGRMVARAERWHNEYTHEAQCYRIGYANRCEELADTKRQLEEADRLCADLSQQ